MKEYLVNPIFPPDSFVEADGEWLPLCAMCTKSRLTCENIYIRELEVTLDENDNPDDHEIVGEVRQQDGSYRLQRLGFKIVDGVKTGLIKSEDDIPIPIVCQWFERKPLG